MEQHLEGRGAELKESVIGTEVFRRTADYNTKSDPIVRTEARRLRARLTEFYERAGAAAAIVIELPKGGYVPVVRVAESSQATPFTSQKLNRLAPEAEVGGRYSHGHAAGLGVGMGTAPAGPPIANGANSPAYDTFLRARDAEMAPACTGAELSAELFEETIAKYVSFAPAYAGLAAMEAARSGFDRSARPSARRC